MVTNEVLELMRKRRSVREFTADDVDEDTLETLLDAASVAPSSLSRRPLHYVLIRDGAVKAKLAGALRVRPYIEQAPVVVVVCGDPKLSQTWELGASAAIENMLLAATSLGLGGVWVGPKGSTMWEESVHVLREATGIPKDIDVLALVCIGHPAEEKAPYEPGEKKDPQRLHYGHWDNLRL